MMMYINNSMIQIARKQTKKKQLNQAKQENVFDCYE